MCSCGVSPNYKLEMHIDTDEGNAAEIRSGDAGVINVTDSLATLRKRAHGRLSFRRWTL